MVAGAFHPNYYAIENRKRNMNAIKRSVLWDTAHDMGRTPCTSAIDITETGYVTIKAVINKHECHIRYNKNRDVAHCFCDCADFRFTFQPALTAVGMSSEYEPYKALGVRPRRSIDDFGWCKHLMALDHADS